MVPDATLELSVEELIDALNKKLFMEYGQVQSAMSPMSRALVATLATKVQSLRKNQTSNVNDMFRRSMPWRKELKMFYMK